MALAFRVEILDGCAGVRESQSSCQCLDHVGVTAPVSRVTPQGRLRQWSVVDEVAPGQIRLTTHNMFEESDDDVVETVTLSFRDREAIERQLKAAGLKVESVFSDWSRAPFDGEAALMVFQARAI